jgi:polysaccharide biosynthesis/export protein
VRDKDVIYVLVAPGADIRDFLSTVTSLAFSAIAIGNVLSSSDSGSGN